jgi:hypothetical protein
MFLRAKRGDRIKLLFWDGTRPSIRPAAGGRHLPLARRSQNTTEYDHASIMPSDALPDDLET